MRLIEVFTKTYPYKKANFDTPTDDYAFTADNGVEIGVSFDFTAGPMHIQFRDLDSNSWYRGEHFGISGKGDAFAILATVNKIVIDVVSKEQPDAFWFTAEEPSRQKLYDRIANRLSGLHGYKRVANGAHYDDLRDLLDFDSRGQMGNTKLYYFEKT